MKHKKFKEFENGGHHRGERHKRKESHHHGAKTFRRGRAIAFLESMHLRHSTIKRQLDEPDYQSIRPILVGELKAIDMVISEFKQLFEIHESEIVDMHNIEIEELEVPESESLDDSEEGNEADETN
ncbi:hypothetical protein KHA96_16815 [Bacillus sp. FJAT-49711]|uniref:hypothetical protein n=1 Tax=Bacillus sp. FJAT-49711 TaxID=2833585 RepID=UPI001BC9B36C|nr:hypothetical protein [Bacillus sp. FJAT-49711]MBS4219975.1 hypothetical protein [Bacillus sp. FJAT-49711]